ncbi:hypothetical protein FQN49_003400 [Arthroderma sp. PD_2]|nr:hypothetical protein FQN49_003400 [Arthroderma sp. PD_2]
MVFRPEFSITTRLTRKRAEEEDVLFLRKRPEDLFFNHLGQLCKSDCGEPTSGGTEVRNFARLAVRTKVFRPIQGPNRLSATDLKEDSPKGQKNSTPILLAGLNMVRPVFAYEIGVLEVNCYYWTVIPWAEEEDIIFPPRLLKPRGTAKLKDRGRQSDSKTIGFCPAHRPESLCLHLKLQHGEDLTEPQIQSLLENSKSTAADTREHCPICLLDDAPLDHHMSARLEQFSWLSVDRDPYAGRKEIYHESSRIPPSVKDAFPELWENTGLPRLKSNLSISHTSRQGLMSKDQTRAQVLGSKKKPPATGLLDERESILQILRDRNPPEESLKLPGQQEAADRWLPGMEFLDAPESASQPEQIYRQSAKRAPRFKCFAKQKCKEFTRTFLQKDNFTAHLREFHNLTPGEIAEQLHLSNQWLDSTTHPTRGNQ